MNGFIDLALIMLAVFSPVIVLVFIKHYFQYKRQTASELATLKQGLESLDNQALGEKVKGLHERVAVLESIVTDKGYALSEKISSLE